jgi:hypothetical protein
LQQVQGTVPVFWQISAVCEVDHVFNSPRIKVVNLERVELVIRPVVEQQTVHQLNIDGLFGQNPFVTGDDGVVLADYFEVGPDYVSNVSFLIFSTCFVDQIPRVNSQIQD